MITRIDGTKLDGDTSLARLIRTKKIGGEIELSIVRDSDERTITVTLGDASEYSEQ